MTQSPRVLGIIPARAGSKRLPGKNMLLLDGKPIIDWTINAAKKSGCIDEIVVTSDDLAVSEVANSSGVTFLERPPILATDTAKTVDVVLHVVNEYKRRGCHYDVIILLQPTSPLRSAEDISNALSLFINNDASSVVSMCMVEHSPLLTCQLNSDGDLSNFYFSIKNLSSRSQDLPTYFRLNGAIYISRLDDFVREASFFSNPGFPYIMPIERSIDIDNEIDYLTAQVFMNK